VQNQFLSAASDGFVPARLTSARNARGMRQNELAEAVGCAPGTISKWESLAYGQSPDQGAILSLSDKLSVSPSWFYKPITANEGAAFFRSMKSALQTARNKTLGKLRFVDDIFNAAFGRVEFPDVDIPNLMEGRDYKTIRSEDIDQIARQLRDYWCLSDDPIDDLMVVIENAGIVVSEDFVDSAKLDGVSQWIDNRPLMLLAKDKEGGVRRRFDAAHELGHLVLHQSVSASDIEKDIALIEEQAMIFAGSFLLPSSSFASDISVVTLDALADSKPKWKVSIGAMIKRASNLHLVTPEHERNLWKYYSYRSWRGNEPHDDRMHVEQPVNLKTAVEMIAEDGSGEIKAFVDEIGLPVEDIARLTGVNTDIFAGSRERPKLKLVTKRSSQSVAAAND